MSYNKTKYILLDRNAILGEGNVWKYTSDESVDTIIASGYFAFDDSDSLDAGSNTSIGDFILIRASDESTLVWVKTLSPTTVVKIAGGDAGHLSLQDGDIFMGDSDNKAAAVTPSGAFTMNNSGFSTLAAQIIQPENFDRSIIKYYIADAGRTSWSGGGNSLLINTTVSFDDAADIIIPTMLANSTPGGAKISYIDMSSGTSTQFEVYLDNQDTGNTAVIGWELLKRSPNP